MALIQISEPSANQEQEGSQDIVIGIDLGTTNSLVAIVVNDTVKFFADELGREIIPSIVKYADEKIEISSIKRLMGKSFVDVKDQKFSFEIDGESKEKEALRVSMGWSSSQEDVEVFGKVLAHVVDRMRSRHSVA